MSKIAVIIPCYNEALRLPTISFESFIGAQSVCDVIFVDDGSSDNTATVLEELSQQLPSRTQVVRMPRNEGKSAAVRAGILHALTSPAYTHVGYLDADLSASLKEFMLLYERQVRENADFIYGSRIRKLHTTIRRSAFRHLTGRAIATIIDLHFDLGIYDTQCGAKCFATPLANKIFEEPFRTRWLFDVEILLRIRAKFPAAHGIEQPLTQWKNQPNSKITAWNAGTIGKEILTLFKSYR